MKKLIILFVMAVFCHNLSAQTWEVGGFAGRSGYMGDLNQIKPYEFNNMAFGALVKRNFNGYFSLKLNYTHGKIEAHDSLSNNLHLKNRNLSFFSPIDELGLQLEFNFFEYLPTIKNKRFSPYLFTGLGAAIFNPKAVYRGDSTNVYNGKTVELNAFGTEGQDVPKTYKKYAASVPYGLGFKYNFSGNWNLVGEIGYRTAFTDYLDDVSDKYPDFSALTNTDDFNVVRKKLADPSVNGVGSPRTQRGDFRKHDTYMFFGLSLTYTFVYSGCYSFF